MRVTYYKRKTGKKSGVWYYRVVDENGKRSAGKSTGETNRKKAEENVTRLIETGQIRITSNPKFKDFAKDMVAMG